MVVDYSNMLVRRLNADGSVETLVGNGRHAYSEVGAKALETPLENPVDARWGPDGSLYVLPQHEGRVIRIDSDDRIERVFGTGALGDSGDGGDPLDAQLGYTGGFAFDGHGSMYVADNTASRVRRVRDGVVETVLGTGDRGLGEAGLGPEVAIANPERIVADGGRLLVADATNHRVLALDIDTLQVTVLGGTGERGFAGDGGPATEALFDRPTGLLPIAGGVLVSDLSNGRLRFIDEQGFVDTVAGTGDLGEELTEMAWPLEMPLRRPAGLAMGPDGDVYIAERSGHRVLRWLDAEAALEP